MKVKRGKKDFWTSAAPLPVDGAGPKARPVRVSPLWSTAEWSSTAWSTAAWSSTAWSTAAWSTAAWSTAAWSTATASTAALDLSYGAPQLAALGAPSILYLLHPRSTATWSTPLRTIAAWSTTAVEHRHLEHQCRGCGCQFSWILQISCSTKA